MAIERAFGILKGTWRILLKRIDVPLKNIPDIVTARLFLHNLCIMESDGFDMEWAKDAEKEMLSEANNCLGDMQNVNKYIILELSLREMRSL